MVESLFNKIGGFRPPDSKIKIYLSQLHQKLTTLYKKNLQHLKFGYLLKFSSNTDIHN